LKKSQNLLSRKQETLLFSKSRKKTSGTLYSVFKEPDPGFDRGRAVPPAQLFDNLRPKTEISEYEFREARSTKTFVGETKSASSRPGKNWKTLSGGRAI
jgi:hypothetical protein